MNNIDERYQEQHIASFWNWKFKDAMVSKAPYTSRWEFYIDAYYGDYFKNKSLPDYKSNMVSNYVFSIIETIRPIMLDNNPKFQAMARQPEGMAFSDDLNEVYSYEWDRERMMEKLCRELITILTIGTSVFFVPWNSEEKNVNAIPINPFNIFPDPLATCVEDAEYIIYADYYNVEYLKQMFPDKADMLYGGQINYSELVRDNDRNARINNQVLVLEVWTKDYEREEYMEDGYKKSRLKYPYGRVITVCPELGIVLKDKSNPYREKDVKYVLPFILVKDYDVPGKFWGEGEVAQLLSPQENLNTFYNSIIDLAKATANMPWIVDKNSGIGYGKITSRPGLIIRKNPGTEVKREQAPSIPQYMVQIPDMMKSDFEQISGIYNTVKGGSETGVYTAQGILALQEAGQARIRLKVKLLELSLARIAKQWYSRMRQFWKDDRWIQITKHDGSYDIKKFNKEILNYDYDIKITAGSTMPVNRGAMLDLMVRLAQTPMPDGQPLVDRESVVHFLPEEIKSSLLKRMKEGNLQVEQQLQQITESIEMLGQNLEQITKESQQNDKQVFDVIEDLTAAIEKINEQILQLDGEHVKMVEEKKKEEEKQKLQEQFYNQGYQDAEKLLASDKEEGGTDLPEEILTGVESLSDDELELIVNQNPELIELLNK